MKYTKPQIVNTVRASFAIMGGAKAPSDVTDAEGLQSIGAYSADE